MSREIRRVPSDWHHPMVWSPNEMPRHKPLRNANEFNYAVDEALAEKLPLPDPNDFMPQFGDEADCYQMYETVSDGTPCSPVCNSLEDLENWLVENNYSRKAAHAFCREGLSISLVMTSDGKIKDGLEAMGGL